MGDDAGADGAVRRPAAVARALVFLASVFLAAWWLIGDLSEGGRVEGGLDHIVEAPDVPSWATAGGGVAGLMVAVAAGLPMLRSLELRGPMLGLLAAAIASALVARLATAGVIGANIGGALALFFGGPVIVVVALGCLVRSGYAHPVDNPGRPDAWPRADPGAAG